MRFCCSEGNCLSKWDCVLVRKELLSERRLPERSCCQNGVDLRCNVFCSVEKTFCTDWRSARIIVTHRSHVSWQLCQWLLKSIAKVLRDPMVSPKHKVSPSLLRGIVSEPIHLCPNRINNKIALTKEDVMIYIFEWPKYLLIPGREQKHISDTKKTKQYNHKRGEGGVDTCSVSVWCSRHWHIHQD